MIETLHLRNFKCFDDAAFDMGKVTLLAGLNGTGKSSVIQSLLALRRFGLAPHSASWHGPLIDLGAFSDILYVGAGEDEIEIAAMFRNGVELKGRFTPDRSTVNESERGAGLSLLRKSMFYLSADRLGPRKTLPFGLQDNGAGTPLGKRGQHVLWYLNRWEHYRVPSALHHSGAATPTLRDETNAWLAAVSPGVELSFRSVAEADMAVAGYSFEQRGDVRTKPFRATNIGFGVSYALPVVVALLAARNDDLVIIENPEAHLHPGGQTSIAELASKVGADGRQVIMETHSDHVLDGIRLAVAENIVSPEDVAIYFFGRDETGVHVTAPEIRPDGSLDSWPEGFFDQQERNLARLVQLRRSRGSDS